MKIKNIVRIIKHPNKIVASLGARGLLKWIPDKIYLKLIFRCETGYRLNLEEPVTFNEKLQWLKLHDRNPEHTIMVDKYEVRNYIKSEIGEEYLIPLINVYDSVEDIDWVILPQRFVLKCTHGSSSNIICDDKNKLDIDISKKKLQTWMKKNWYWFGREWPYKDVIPRIVCEKFISENNTVPEDYKFLCFNGKVKLIQIHIDRFSTSHTQDFYNVNWEKTTTSQYGETASEPIKKPYCFEKMVELSEKLSKNMKHVRIDWFVVNNKLYFGEITFFDASGFEKFDNYDDDLLLGSWIDLK